ncbi:hypothetical protein RvVAT039_pl03170 (plasmid) [Agrobacterium vitis]|uniref:class I SAM-dependent methyltransferase n=1 Tax=Agrobacterium vitis TaxID=373 RepID=UPI0015DB6716|nr:class I SAM-dependent methyltransferase [Agrobacterium vitis]BCH67484.1 hypothetical protein RvVAT039_pl03170 [Agrobacterium vitis]
MGLTGLQYDQESALAVERCLHLHPAVNKAVVLPQVNKAGKRTNVAFVQLATNFEETDGLPLLESEHVQQWERIFNDTYSGSLPNVDASIQQVGWNSSYTGEPIPRAEMDDWLEATLARLQPLQQNQILEIGCGSGMLLSGLCTNFATYVGTDFSERTITQLQGKFADLASNGKNVSFVCAEAKDFSNVPPHKYDLVLINSVAQYFPGLDYLSEVIEKSLSVLSDDGVIFIGDVRDYRLLEVFHLSVLLHGRGETPPGDQALRRKLQRSVETESELLVDPTWFLLLRDKFPGVSGVAIMPKISKYINEMSAFRYDVMVQKGPGSRLPTEVNWIEFSKEKISPENIPTLLRCGGPDPIGLRGLQNPHLARFLSEYRRHILDLDDEPALASISCSELMSICRGLDMRAFLSLVPEASLSSYSAVVYRPDGPSIFDIVPTLKTSAKEGDHSNDPLSAQKNAAFVRAVRAYVHANLPGHAPRSVFRVSAIPNTPDGSVDRAAMQKHLDELY